MFNTKTDEIYFRKLLIDKSLIIILISEIDMYSISIGNIGLLVVRLYWNQYSAYKPMFIPFWVFLVKEVNLKKSYGKEAID